MLEHSAMIGARSLEIEQVSETLYGLGYDIRKLSIIYYLVGGLVAQSAICFYMPRDTSTMSSLSILQTLQLPMQEQEVHLERDAFGTSLGARTISGLAANSS
ncbi:hypothetical protein I7I48_08071 [Histoplasma ohiense]|nr:hypothetical protein I7I48_08071 [Histoplasma ohiense (nom. inval.)]